MDNIIYIAVGIFLSLIVLIAFAWRYYKYRKKISELEETIPEEVLTIFDKAENKMKGGNENNGERTSPHKILWELARDNARGTRIIEREKPEIRGITEPIPSRELHEQSSRQESVQNGNAKEPSFDSKSTSDSKRKRIKSFIRRKRK